MTHYIWAAMRQKRAISMWIPTLLIGLVLMVFSACSKSHDDCVKPSAPASTGSSDTRNMTLNGVGQGSPETSSSRPGVSYRSGTTTGATGGEEGISDDGDDEADSEGSNKKGKNTH